MKGTLSFDSKIDGIIAADQAMSTANEVLEVESLSTEYPESASEQFGINSSNGQFEISGDRTSLRIDTNVYQSSDSMRVVFVE